MTSYKILNILKYRRRETYHILAAQKEYYRKFYLSKTIWVNLFSFQDQKEAEKQFFLIKKESDKSAYCFIEYLAKVYETNGELTKLEFFKFNLEKIYDLLEYILGYRPELENFLSKELLKQAAIEAENIIKSDLTNRL